jgi:hypothetical protein
MITLSTGDVIAVLFALAGLIVSIVAFFRAHPNATPAALDAEVTRRLTELEADRANVARLETAYQNAGEVQKHAIDALVSALKLIAPMTAGTADDAAVKLLEDIQTPGAPIPPEPPAQG